MKKPSLAELAQLAEIVAALAVIISLVYLASEVRSNTAAIRAASLQGLSDASAEILLTSASDSALSRIRQIGDQDVSRLTGPERYRYATLIRQVLLTMQNAYFQHRFGVLDERVWSGYSRIICDMWSNPGLRDTWDLHRRVLDPDFVAVVESCSSTES